MKKFILLGLLLFLLLPVSVSARDNPVPQAYELSATQLLPGWNLIGVPLDVPISWSDIQFRYYSSLLNSPEAVRGGLIEDSYYWYDNRIHGYVMEQITDGGMLINWRGYWIKAYVPLRLVVR